jgi:hypothetical protein
MASACSNRADASVLVLPKAMHSDWLAIKSFVTYGHIAQELSPDTSSTSAAYKKMPQAS